MDGDPRDMDGRYSQTSSDYYGSADPRGFHGQGRASWVQQERPADYDPRRGPPQTGRYPLQNRPDHSRGTPGGGYGQRGGPPQGRHEDAYGRVGNMQGSPPNFGGHPARVTPRSDQKFQDYPPREPRGYLSPSGSSGAGVGRADGPEQGGQNDGRYAIPSQERPREQDQGRDAEGRVEGRPHWQGGGGDAGFWAQL